MVWAVRQHVSELVGGAFAVALEQERGAEAVQRTHIAGREHQRARERELGVCRIDSANIDTPELDPEVRHRWRKLGPLLEDSFGFVVAAQTAKDEAKLVERPRECGPATDRALKPRDRLVLAPNVAQRKRIMGLEERIGAVACSLR